MKYLAIVLVALGCGSGAEPQKAVPVPAAPVALPPRGAAPPSAIAAPVPAPVAALATCSDGDALAAATITPDAVRFCLGDARRSTCWALAIAGGAIQPIAERVARDHADPAAVVVDPDPQHPAVRPGAWSTKVVDRSIAVCGPAGCKELDPAPGKSDDDDGAAVDAAAVSATGRLVAVTRGVPGIARMTVDLYDRASGKRLGVARPRAACTYLEGFAGETAVVQEWDCANQGGNRLLIGPTGKVLARIDRFYSHLDRYLQIAGERWAFAGSGNGSIEIYDVASGKRLGGRELEQDALVVAGHERAIAFEPNVGRVRVFGADGKELASGRVPPCRYEWETELLGALHHRMATAEIVKAIGGPARKSPPDPSHFFASRWTYANGVTLLIQASNVDPSFGRPVLPYQAVGIAVTAPSQLRIRGVGIGSTAAEVAAAFDPHRLAAKTTPAHVFAGNPDEDDGIVLELAGGQVARVVIGSDPAATP